MKSSKYIFAIAAALLLIVQTGFAQTKMYGINVGLGTTEIVAEGAESAFISPIDADNKDFLQIGLDYQYAPGNSSIFFKSGLMYNARASEDRALDYLRVPLGIDIGIGNAFQFIFGASAFASYLLAHTGYEDNAAFMDTKQRFQVGWGGNLGFGLDLSERVNFNVMYHRNFDITEMYTVEPVGKNNELSENFTGQDGFVKMGLNYKILVP